MSITEKLIKRFKTLPTDFTFEELEKLLNFFGYERSNKGKTSGSRVVFKNKEKRPIMIHKPHDGNVIKEYAMRQVYNYSLIPQHFDLTLFISS